MDKKRETELEIEREKADARKGRRRKRRKRSSGVARGCQLDLCQESLLSLTTVVALTFRSTPNTMNWKLI